MCYNICWDIEFKEKKRNESDINSIYISVANLWVSKVVRIGYENNRFEAGAHKLQYPLKSFLSWINRMSGKILAPDFDRNR